MIPEESETLNHRVDKHGCAFFLAFYAFGTINNNGYVIVQAAASDLARSFHEENFMGFFLFFMRGAGIITRLVNGACCVNVRHLTRVIIATLITAISFGLIAAACLNENKVIFFWVAVVASVLQGIAQSFGEAVILGFSKGFPNRCIGNFSAGTGFSGVFATGVLLGAKAIKMKNSTLFFIEMPTVFIYFFSFYWLVTQKKTYKFLPEYARSPRSQKIKPVGEIGKDTNNHFESIVEETVD